MINEVGGFLVDGAKAVLPMLVPKGMEITLGDTKEWQPQAFPDPMVLITTNFSAGPSGSVYYLTATSNASQIVDVMLGGEGSKDRNIDDEAIDGLKEIANQMLGVLASSLREVKDTTFAVEQVEVHSLEANMDLGLLLDDDTTHMYEITVAFEGETPFVIYGCVPNATMESINEQGPEAEEAAPAPVADDGVVDQSMVDSLVSNTSAGGAAPAPAAAPAQQAAAPAAAVAPDVAVNIGKNIGLLLDIDLPIVIRLGTTEMTLKEIMKLGPGAIVELNKSVDEPVELLVNNRPIAQGEVVVVEGNFAFRVTDVESKQQRLQTLS
jgi:flagellar motor switch protein FliN/FliY